MERSKVADDDGVLRLVQKRGLLADFFLGVFPVGHVNHHADHAERFAGGVINRRGAVIDVEIGAVGAAQAVFAPPDAPAAGHHRGEAGNDAGAVVGMD